jgi:sugar lactone lactonase YvrE
MLRFICRSLGTFLAVCLVLTGVGCGGGSSPTPGSTTTPVQSSSQVVTAIVSVNVTTGQVSITPTKATGRTVFTGSTLSMATSNLLIQAGSPGVKTTTVSITNTSAQPIGIDPNGNVTGITVIFGTFTVTGGSSPDSVLLSNPTGIIPNTSAGTNGPYISYPAQIAPNKTSPAQNWNFIVPSGITAFTFTVTLEADNSYLAPSQGASGSGSTSTYVRTFAGGPSSGYVNGSVSTALFSGFVAVALDSANNIYVADSGNQAIRRITPSGSVSTIAGSPYENGSADGAGNVATFYEPSGIAVTPDGSTLYVADSYNDEVRRVTLAPATDPTNPDNWTVSTIAGTGTPGGTYIASLGNIATLDYPVGIALDAGGNIYVTEFTGNRVRRLAFLGGDPSNAANWEVSLLAGDISANGGLEGDQDGNGTAARFEGPVYAATDLAGNVYVADSGSDRIRKISSSGNVSTLAGGTSGSTVTAGYQDGAAASALFRGPYGVAVDKSGIVYVCDTGNRRFREITPAGNVSTLAGTSVAQFINGSGNVASFIAPASLAVTSSGTLFVADEAEIRLLERINSQ